MYSHWYFLKNGYPDNVLSNSIRSTIVKFNTRKSFGLLKCPVYIKLPWIVPVNQVFADNISGKLRGCGYWMQVRDAFKQVGLNKLPGLDGLTYKEYLRMSHMFCPYSERYVQSLVCTRRHYLEYQQGGDDFTEERWQHVCENLDDYRPITLLNIELKILARVLANRLQLVVTNLIGPK